MSKKQQIERLINSGESLAVEDVFSTYLVTGNGSTQPVVNDVNLLDEGGMVWLKTRNVAGGHQIFDTERGVLNQLETQLTQAEAVAGNSLTSFNVDGFTLGTNRTDPAEDRVTHTFRKAPRFFDVVEYTGDGVAGREIAHSLGIKPGFLITKSTSATGEWWCQHTSLSGTDRIALNSTGATGTAAIWNDTDFDASNFTLGANGWGTNDTGVEYIAYLFAHDPLGPSGDGSDGMIACGSYTGTGAVRNDISLGWEPQFVLIKRASGGVASWGMYDNMRGVPTGGITALLRADLTNAETTTPLIEFTADGFGMEVDNANISNPNTYIYMAIRRPMKVPTGGDEVFHPENDNSGVITTGFVPDLAIVHIDGQWTNNPAFTRLLGSKYLSTNLTNSEGNGSAAWDLENGKWSQSTTGGTPAAWLFKRAPQFMDVVCYDGTASELDVSHGLGAVPELMIVKTRTGTAQPWIVYTGDVTKYMTLNDTIPNSNWSVWGTGPTSEVFTVANANALNFVGYTHVAYLFATCPGVSKVGSFSHTNGATTDVDCGFTGGSRMALVKRTDAAGDWYLWDTVRGIVAGNDPYLLLNSTAAEVTSTDYIDPLSNGFQVSSNFATGDYIFLSIA